MNMKKFRKLIANTEKTKPNKVKVLSVIVILAIIAVIATLIILSIIDDSNGNLKQRDVNPSDIITDMVADNKIAGRYVFRGSNAKNWIQLKEGNTLVDYRIVSIEPDGTLKVVRNESVTEIPYDNNGSNGRNNSNNTYCQWTPEYDYGCNVWSAVDGTYITYARSGTVTQDATINTYLNENFYDTLAEKVKNVIVTKSYNISSINSNLADIDLNRDALYDEMESESKKEWEGKIGLITSRDWFMADNGSGENHGVDNYFSNFIGGFWTMTPYMSDTDDVYTVMCGNSGDCGVGLELAFNSNDVRPAFYLSSNIQLTGDGISKSPYKIK
jgi:hypothetical protein